MDKILNSFIDTLIEQKKLQFSVDEITVDPALIENGTLRVENSQVFISDYKTISGAFIKGYKQNLTFLSAASSKRMQNLSTT